MLKDDDKSMEVSEDELLNEVIAPAPPINNQAEGMVAQPDQRIEDNFNSER